MIVTCVNFYLLKRHLRIWQRMRNMSFEKLNKATREIVI